MKPLFQIDRESFSYGAEVALAEVRLQINLGEKIALIGPSGAGKTALLTLLADRATVPYSFVLQHYGLVSELSLFHNVYLGRLDEHRALYNLLNLLWPQNRERQQIEPILARLGLAGLGGKKASELSGGQRQRAAIARALYRPGSLLLADEPVSALDPVQARDLLRLMYQSRETVILAIHSVELALEQAERILGFQNGEILFDLPSDQVTEAWLNKLYSSC